ncbi:MAG: HlyD family efflux transporter periplasmic adaptor subunit, partial [Planctomycetales bacterium]|nr:HlyD family efflux transporter periplasmic adaptor subunit [Planctomycetales bacterium]
GRAFYDAGDDSKTESDTSGEVTRRELRRDCLYVPTPSSGGTPAEASWTLELFFEPNVDLAVREGRKDFLGVVSETAADYLAFAELRRLTATQQIQSEANELLRRVYACTDVRAAATVIAAEGRRLVGCQRLCVAMKSKRRWRVLAASGAEGLPVASDLTRRWENLAQCTANWGEPVWYSDRSERLPEYPGPLAQALAEHIDVTEVRNFSARAFSTHAASPLGEGADGESAFVARDLAPPDLVLIAESFGSEASGAIGDRVTVEQLTARLQLVGAWTAPAAAQAKRLGTFPVNVSWRATEWMSERIASRGRLIRVVAVLTMVAALGFAAMIPTPWRVELAAMLRPMQRSEIFATTDGIVDQILVGHGDVVEAGEALLVLRDPQLSLDRQRVAGELATARQRLAAVAAARTTRRLREHDDDLATPLSAQQQQLQQQVVELERELTLLDARHDELTLRSPRQGRVQTSDVETLLAHRPVARGQALLTIADEEGPWELTASASQRSAGRLIAAKQRAEETQTTLDAEYRLAGELDHTHRAHVAAILPASELGAENLMQPAPTLEVRLEAT